MRKPAAYLTAILVGAIVWFFFQHFQIEGADDLRVVPKGEQQLNTVDATSETDNGMTGDPNMGGGTRESVLPGFPFPTMNLGKRKPATATADGGSTDEPVTTAKRTSTKNVDFAPKRNPNTIRVASFHLHFFGSQASNSELTMNAVARVVRLFDVIALQGISPGGEASVADVAAKAGSKYAYLLGAAPPITQQDEVFAFVYNTDTIVADRGEGLYTLGDPDDLLRRDPLIGWFKAKQAPDADAFTFTLVNVNTERRHALQELNVLDNVFHEVRQDWREEDDVIMLGCFERPETNLEELGRVRNLVPAVRGVATNLRGDKRTENILFRRQETDEFTGRGGVYNFLRAYNLSMNQALQVSEYLPVWAEFSIYERGRL